MKIAFVKCLSLMIDLLFQQGVKVEFDTLFSVEGVQTVPRALKTKCVSNECILCFDATPRLMLRGSIIQITKSLEQTWNFLLATSPQLNLSRRDEQIQENLTADSEGRIVKHDLTILSLKRGWKSQQKIFIFLFSFAARAASETLNLR